MKNTALITGASGGIGLELARIHAAHKQDLVLVARNKEKLEELKAELKQEYSIAVYIIQKDLSKVNAAQEVYEETQKHGIQIKYLINNAGIGDFGDFVESDWQKQADMIQLNITALTQLCHLYLKDMIKERGGRIMNVASTAAFQPGPLMSVYYASKSYVLHFSEALNEEVRKKGVKVITLCPGATESDFSKVANMEESGLFKGKKNPSSKEVAIYGYNAMMKGKIVAIHGVKNKVLALSNRFTPRSIVVKVVKAIQQKVK